MKKITNLAHPKETYLFAISRTLERASYYGLRALIFFYMVHGILKMDDSDASVIYGWFTGSFLLSQIIGATLGDLLLGNKKALKIGAILQASGAFSLCIPSTAGLYAGIFLVSLGGGLYTPNIISEFGKLYLKKTRLLDSAFTFFYFVINMGALVGVVGIGYVGEKFGWTIGFVLAGIVMLLSIIPILFSKETAIDLTIVKQTTLRNRVIKISIALISVGVFWAMYDLANVQFITVQEQLSQLSIIGISERMWSSIHPAISLPVLLLAAILWRYFYSTQFFKLGAGFIFGALSFGLLFLIPGTPVEDHLVLYLISIVFLNISEILIAPIIHSVLTQYTNPKYLAIFISLAFIPARMFSLIGALFYGSLYENPSVAVMIGFITMAVWSIGLILYYRIDSSAKQYGKPGFP